MEPFSGSLLDPNIPIHDIQTYSLDICFLEPRSVCDYMPSLDDCGAALHLRGEERKVHPHCSHEMGKMFGPGLTHERFELIQLFLSERRSPESYRVIRLWTSTLELFCAIPSFVDTFAKIIEMFNTKDS